MDLSVYGLEPPLFERIAIELYIDFPGLSVGLPWHRLIPQDARPLNPTDLNASPTRARRVG